MVPELAVVYVVGWIPAVGASALQVYLYDRKTKKPESKQLQRNLAKIGKFWAESQGKVLSTNDGSERRDRKSFIRSVSIMGLLFFFLSWIGVFFNLLVMISMHYLAVSRLERKIFSSDLVKTDLDAKQTEAIFSEIASLAP